MTPQSKLRIWQLWLAPLVLAACASGPNPEEGQKITFERFEAADRDGDGKLSREEFEAAYPEQAMLFDRLDSDRSGRVSWGEMKAMRFGFPRPPREAPLRQ